MKKRLRKKLFKKNLGDAWPRYQAFLRAAEDCAKTLGDFVVLEPTIEAYEYKKDAVVSLWQDGKEYIIDLDSLEKAPEGAKD